MESNNVFMDHVGSKHGQSERSCLEAREIVVTEVVESVLIKFDTEVEMKTHVATLKFWEQEQYTLAKENYNKYSMVVRQRLSSVYGTLFPLCEVSLRSRLEAEPECQKMVKTKRYCAMKLYELARKNYNGSTHVVVDDVVGNILEALYNVLLITGDDFQSLPKYLEAS